MHERLKNRENLYLIVDEINKLLKPVNKAILKDKNHPSIIKTKITIPAYFSSNEVPLFDNEK